jgi:putative phosphoribosyl transferase
VFRDRRDAGRQLARLLHPYANRSDVIVLALPRGGVPIAAEVAADLRAPFDVFLVRKLGVPFHPELAMGAVAEGGAQVLNREVIEGLGISESEVATVLAREQAELSRRAHAFRGARSLPVLTGQTVILVDDGLATGATMEAAVIAVREQRPARVIVAVPVGARETCERLKRVADDVVCSAMPEPFQAVGLWYDDFEQLTDEDVTRVLGDPAR